MDFAYIQVLNSNQLWESSIKNHSVTIISRNAQADGNWMRKNVRVQLFQLSKYV